MDPAGISPQARPDYGYDAPSSMLWLGGGAGVAMIIAIVILLTGGAVVDAAWWLVIAVGMGAGTLSYAHATRRGKHRAWARLLDAHPWQGDERVIDLGCGRGAVLNAVAHRLPNGSVVGVDIWNRGDQSGNAAATTLANARAEGGAERVALATADITALPFARQSFDAATSSLVLHNLHDRELRRRAVEEAVAVVRPGGRVIIADIMRVGEYAGVLSGLGLHDVEVHGLGPGTWFGNPFVRMRVVTATTPPSDVTPNAPAESADASADSIG